MGRARFLLQPRWLLSHVFVLVLIVTMINLGFWQLRRLDDRRDRNDLIESRSEQPEVAVGDLLDPGDDRAAVDRSRFRTVTATGRYDAAATVQVRNRSLNGSPGAWLVTPLVLDPRAPGGGGASSDGDAAPAGETVAVIRGFVGFLRDGTTADPPPPDGEVTVRGLVMDPDRLGGTAARDLEPLLAEDGVLPAVVLAQESEPPEPAAPPADGDGGADAAAAAQAGTEVIVPVPPPDLTEGPHLSYAVQWFIFSAIGLIGYPLVLRRVVQRRGKEADDPDAGPLRPDAADDLDHELEELLRKGE